MLRSPVSIIAPALALFWGGPACAQNTSGVSSADVGAGEREIGYRAAYRLDGESADGFAQRIHYQQSLDDRWRLRLIALQSYEGGDLKFRSVQPEILLQFVESERSGGWNSAVRADGTVPLDNGSPGRARLGWLNQFGAGGGWEFRADVFIAREIGDLASNAISFEARAEATYAASPGLRIGAQSFNTVHTSDATEQRRQLGAVLKSDVTERLSLETSVLFGLSPDAPDADLRVFLALAL